MKVAQIPKLAKSKSGSDIAKRTRSVEEEQVPSKVCKGSIKPECYQEADFPRFPDDQGLTFLQYLEYKRALLGTVVPQQYVSDEAIIKAGYLNWKHYTIVSGMMNW